MRAPGDPIQAQRGRPRWRRQGPLLSGLGLAIALAFATLVPFTQTIRLHGKLTTRRETQSVRAPAAAFVAELAVRVGEHVDKGALLMSLDPNVGPAGLLELAQRSAAAAQSQSQLRRAQQVVTQLLAGPDKVRSLSLGALGVVGDTFALINDLYTARLAFDAANDYRRLGAAHQRAQLGSEAELAQRHIELLKRNLATTQKSTEAREAALQAKRHDLEGLLKLADKGLVSGTDVGRERDAVLQAELALTDNRKQVDQIELEISNRTLHISELGMQRENIEEEASSRLSAAKLRYDLQVARLGAHRDALAQQLQGSAVPMAPSGQASRHAPPALQITSPIAGMVTQLGCAAAGDEVQFGMLLAKVVPDDAPPVALLQVGPAEALRLHAGQAAQVTIDAYATSQGESLPGRILTVFALPDDATFAATVQLERSTLQVGGVQAPLLPNLRVHADVVVGRRRPIDMLTEP